MTFFDEEVGFWKRRDIASLEEGTISVEQDPDLQGLQHRRQRDPQTQAGATSGTEMRDAPSSEEEDRQ
jgi:hypothetical protein